MQITVRLPFSQAIGQPSYLWPRPDALFLSVRLSFAYIVAVNGHDDRCPRGEYVIFFPPRVAHKEKLLFPHASRLLFAPKKKLLFHTQPLLLHTIAHREASE